MSAFGLSVRRSAAQSGLLLTILGVTVVVSGVLVGLAGYLDLAVASAARGIISKASPADAAARLEIKAKDPAGQAEAMAGLLEPRFADTSVSIDRAVAIYPLPVIHASDGSFPSEEAVAQLPGLTVPGGDAEARLHILADPSLPERAVLDAGEWPSAGGAALNSKAAELFDIGVGDLLLVGSEGKAKTLVVSGLWSPLDAGEAYWMGDPGVATGEGHPAGDGTRGFGPLVVDESTLLSLEITPTAWWTIVPSIDTITPAQWERLDRALTGLQDEVRALPNAYGAASVISGGLASTAKEVLTGLGAIRGVTPVGVVLVGILGLVTLVQLARLLSLARRPETALLRSRGASAAWLTVVSGVEALVIATVGTALGLGAASALLHSMFGGEAATVLPWPYALGVAASVLGVLTLLAWRESARVSRRDTVDDSGRARSITTLATTVLALAAAGVATWQSLLYGSPVVTDASGRLSVNPLAVLAPALCLIAGALVVLLALDPLSRLAEAAVVRSRKLQPAYSVRQVARGLVSYSAAILVIALATGGVVVAAGYSATWQHLSERSARLATGADVRALLDGDAAASVNTTPLTDFGRVPGVTTVARALTMDISVGEDAALIALPAASLAEITTAIGADIDAVELAGLLARDDDVGVPLPPETTAISIDVEYSTPAWPQPPGFPSALTRAREHSTFRLASEVWLQDAHGALHRVALGTEVVPGTGDTTRVSYRVDVPGGAAPWTLEGFDASTEPTGYGDALITFDNVRTHAPGDSTGTSLPIDFASWSVWFADAYRFDVGALDLESTTSSITLRFSAEIRGASARVSPGGDGRGWYQPFADAPTIPIAIDERLAERLAVGVGDDVVLGARSYTIPGTIVALLPYVPGTASAYGVIVDLNSLNTEFLRSVNPVPLPNELWVVGDGSVPLADTASAVAELLGAGASIGTVDDATQSAFPLPAEIALWVAAAASLVLAMISLGAVTLTIARGRRGEVGVLRAVGVHAAAQARARFIEVTLLVITALATGALVGAAATTLTVPGLARSVVVGVPEGLATPIAYSWVTGGALLAAALLAAHLISLVYALRVRAQALDTDERIETR